MPTLTSTRAHLKPPSITSRSRTFESSLVEMTWISSFSQVHPKHLESACEWAGAQGLLEIRPLQADEGQQQP